MADKSQDNGWTSQTYVAEKSYFSAKISFVASNGRKFYFGDITNLGIVMGNRKYFLNEGGTLSVLPKRGGKGCRNRRAENRALARNAVTPRQGYGEITDITAHSATAHTDSPEHSVSVPKREDNAQSPPAVSLRTNKLGGTFWKRDPPDIPAQGHKKLPTLPPPTPPPSTPPPPPPPPPEEREKEEDIFWTFERLKKEFPSYKLDSEENKMIYQAKKFLDKESKIRKPKKTCCDKPHDEKSVQEDQLGPNYEKNQIIPRGVIFCFICQLYKRKIHFCDTMQMYFNFDYNNLLMIQGNKPEQVEGIKEDMGGKLSIFSTIREMREKLFSIGQELRDPLGEGRKKERRKLEELKGKRKNLEEGDEKVLNQTEQSDLETRAEKDKIDWNRLKQTPEDLTTAERENLDSHEQEDLELFTSIIDLRTILRTNQEAIDRQVIRAKLKISIGPLHLKAMGDKLRHYKALGRKCPNSGGKIWNQIMRKLEESMKA